eukprot:scaffold148219_cov54-Attheya_sp.AAC.2
MRSWLSSDAWLALYPANMADPGLGQGTTDNLGGLGGGLGVGLLVAVERAGGLNTVANMTLAPTTAPAVPATVAILDVVLATAATLEVAPVAPAALEVAPATPATPALVATIAAATVDVA